MGPITLGVQCDMVDFVWGSVARSLGVGRYTRVTEMFTIVSLSDERRSQWRTSGGFDVRGSSRDHASPRQSRGFDANSPCHHGCAEPPTLQRTLCISLKITLIRYLRLLELSFVCKVAARQIPQTAALACCARGRGLLHPLCPHLIVTLYWRVLIGL